MPNFEPEEASDDLQLAMAMRLLAKAIYLLREAGRHATANQLLREAKSFGMYIVIDPTAPPPTQAEDAEDVSRN